MREKNVRRAAHALYMCQADDKNKLLSRYCRNEKARDLIQDQGRALLLLEKLILPKGKDAFTEEEVYFFLSKKLLKKGHRIQGDEEEDTALYAQEKEQWEQKRKAQVPNLFGVTLDSLEPELQPTLDKPKKLGILRWLLRK